MEKLPIFFVVLVFFSQEVLAERGYSDSGHNKGRQEVVQPLKPLKPQKPQKPQHQDPKPQQQPQKPQNGGNGDHHGYDHGSSGHKKHPSKDWLVPLIGGAILGAILTPSGGDATVKHSSQFRDVGDVLEYGRTGETYTVDGVRVTIIKTRTAGDYPERRISIDGRSYWYEREGGEWRRLDH